MIKKRCTKCLEEKPPDEFPANSRSKDGRGWRCRQCQREYFAEYYQQTGHSERIKSRTQRRRQELTSEALAAYGGRCVDCEEDDPEVLTFDHVDNDGGQHRRELAKGKRGSTTQILRWAKQNGWPPRLQVLCANCHLRKTRRDGTKEWGA